PEVVVLVEVALLALGEVVAPACEPVLERGERLLAVDSDALGLGRNLVLEVGEVGLPLLDVDRRDDRGREVEDLLELARRADDQSRICLLEAIPIRIASKSLMSITGSPRFRLRRKR